jgi:nitrous oxide reductase accessory protein NosL
MRDADLPAFSSREAAATLARSRGGRVLGLTDVTPELILSLNRSVHHRH